MSDLSRRSLLACVPATAVAATPVAVVAAVAVAAGLDAVFAAIEAHRAAWSLFSDTPDPTDTHAAAWKGRTATDADHAAYDEIFEAEDDAWDTVLAYPCETLEAVRAKAAYLVSCPRTKDLAWEDHHVLALLSSLIGGVQ